MNMSTNRIERAVALFESGFNCAQAVFSAYAGDGIGEEAALRLATGFGGGLGRRGELCGAAAGAVLALGSRFGRATLEDAAARDRTYELVAEFLRRFREREGSILCRDLLGLDLAQEGAHALAVEKGLFRERCPGFVRAAAEILAGMIGLDGD